MSRSKNQKRKAKNDVRYHGGWFLESTRVQRRRLSFEVDKAAKNLDHDVVINMQIRSHYDYP